MSNEPEMSLTATEIAYVDAMANRTKQAMKVLEAVKALHGDIGEWLCVPCNTIHPTLNPTFLNKCPTCESPMLPTSYNLRKIATLREKLRIAEEALESVRKHYEPEYKMGRIPAEPFVMCGNALAEIAKVNGSKAP